MKESISGSDSDAVLGLRDEPRKPDAPIEGGETKPSLSPHARAIVVDAISSALIEDYLADKDRA